ncbi:MAG: PDZ domain-containing protein [Bacteroidota bacterium]
MKYQLRFDPTKQVIQINIITSISEGSTRFQLPKWRPGRYELQNFARLIFDVKSMSPEGTSLTLKQVDSHSWEVISTDEQTVHFSYSFYANLHDAGGTYLDREHLLFNGITCLMYRPDQMESSCEMSFEVPDGWRLGSALGLRKGPYTFKSFHELVDTPFLAGPSLQHHRMEAGGIDTHLWFLGTCRPNIDRISHDIQAYTEAQMSLFGDCPLDTYHYLFVMWPFPYRHGVEHYNSTVIVMGPGVDLMQEKFYGSFLEISSHELFHTWNVKYIRPQDMLPYVYDRENYSEMHYITEGITTYYGDLMLWKGHVWNIDRWVHSINQELQSHYMTGGQDYISLSQASFQSWTHGYRQSTAPNRKISFYTKGYLAAMILDQRIRQQTDDAHSLDDVMHYMYQEVAKKGQGYTESIFRDILKKFTGNDQADFFEHFIHGTTSLKTALKEMGAYYGLMMLEVPPADPAIAWWGIKTKVANGKLIVDHLYEDSPAMRAGIVAGDELIALNGHQLGLQLDHWMSFLSDTFRAELHYFHQGKLQVAQLPLKGNSTFTIPQFVIQAQCSEDKQKHRINWQAVGGAKKPTFVTKTEN